MMKYRKRTMTDEERERICSEIDGPQECPICGNAIILRFCNTCKSWFGLNHKPDCMASVLGAHDGHEHINASEAVILRAAR